MYRQSFGRPAALLLVALALVLTGCAGRKHPTLAYEERPVELLYDTGADRLDNHRWSEAVDYFREVERQHPYSEWSRRAILMTAYAHYQANNYAEAISDADRFISLYPGNASTPYAYYLKSVCYFEQIVDVGRDQASTEEAGKALREVIKRYPYTEYAADARVKSDMISDQLAGKEMTIGRFYLRSGDPIGAISRFRTVVDKYQTTSHTPEALYRLVEAYLTIGLVEEAKRNAAVLGYNYPGDPWYSDAYNLLTSRGLRPAISPRPGGPRGIHLPSFGRHKDTTIAPPAITAGDSAGTSQAATEAAPVVPPPPTDQSTPAKPATPAKQGGLVHGVLGL